MVEERQAAAALAVTRDQESVPDAIVGRLIDGESPIRVWREHRGLSLRALAARAGTSPSVLSDMETGKSKSRPALLRRIAGILRVTLDELVPATDREAMDTG
jgi:ribosome-binding protein aMBF1 (putative translation factor)